MLSALLGAICAASLAFAPALVSPSSNGLNNDGDFSTVHSAYYDADSVSEYSTEVNSVCNYTGFDITSSVQNSSVYQEGETIFASIDDTTKQMVLVFNTNLGGGSSTFTLIDSNNPTLDFYIDGTFYVSLTPVEGVYTLPIVSNEDYDNWGVDFEAYGWFFEHENPYTLGTDTVADIAEGLTSGIGTVATGIGGGLGSLMQNIFLVGNVDGEGNFTATGLSTFGIVTICFAGLGLALGLSRWIVGFASSLGSRNR